MWAMRRASNLQRVQGLTAATFCWSVVHPPSTRRVSEGSANNLDKPNVLSDISFLNTSSNTSYASPVWGRSLASKAENDDDFFSEVGNTTQGGFENRVPYSESASSDDEGISTRIVESCEDEIKFYRFSSKEGSPPELFTIVAPIPVLNVEETLNKIIEEGKKINEGVIRETVYHLRRRHMFARALQVLNWFAANKNMELSEEDYICHIDLIARQRGISEAESHIETIPRTYRTEKVYRTLLVNAVRTGKLKKCEDIFNYTKTHFPITIYACNLMIVLYTRFNRSRIKDLLLLMEKNNLKPTLFTYSQLIKVKGSSKDIPGMEDVVATMKTTGVKPNSQFLALVAKHYLNNGHQEKAEALLKEVEEGGSNGEDRVYTILLRLYARMGRADEVRRLWAACKSEANMKEYQVAVHAWGLVGDVAKAEEVFNEMATNFNIVPGFMYVSLLEVYANKKMVTKGEELMRRMANERIPLGPAAVNMLVKMYVKAGEIEKAESALHTWTSQNDLKLRYSTYMVLMGAYASKGNVHNAEMVFRRLKQSSYRTGGRCFYTLLQAYVNSGTTAYGMKERLFADSVYPSKIISAQLAKVDPSRMGRLPTFLVNV